MKKNFNIIITLFFLCASIFWRGVEAYAQTNLVPNYSFEDYNFCPTITNGSCKNTEPAILSLKDWMCAFTSNSTPDHYDNCNISNYGFNNWMGYQKAKTGNAYMGGFVYVSTSKTENSEYIECQLKSSLKPNINYCVNFYLNRADKAKYTLSQFGAAFTNTQTLVNGTPINGFINLVPQVKNPLGSFIKDSVNWTKIEDTFIATGGENYMTLGSFGPKSLTDTLFDDLPIYQNLLILYYYLDDVSVEAVTNAQAGRDTIINCGTTTSIGADSTIGATYKWFPKTGLNFDTIAFPLATPTITTKYVLQKTQCHIITYDTVNVTVINACPYINTVDEFMIPNVFTPNSDGINDVWEFNLGFGNTITNFSMYNRWGLEVASNPSPSGRLGGASWDGHTTSGEECSGGVYFYTLQYTNILGEQKKVNGYVTLIR